MAKAKEEASLVEALMAQTQALQESVKAGRPKPVPRFGPAPTDPVTGERKMPDAVFRERDGKEYPAVIEDTRVIGVDHRVGHTGGVDKWRHEDRTVFDVRVNFGNERTPDWRGVTGIYGVSAKGHEDRRRDKRWVVPIEQPKAKIEAN